MQDLIFEIIHQENAVIIKIIPNDMCVRYLNGTYRPATLTTDLNNYLNLTIKQILELGE